MLFKAVGLVSWLGTKVEHVPEEMLAIVLSLKLTALAAPSDALVAILSVATDVAAPSVVLSDTLVATLSVETDVALLSIVPGLALICVTELVFVLP